MYETTEDIARVQQLLDDSYAGIGEHMKSIHTPDRRVAAGDLGPILRGVRVLDLATVTANCEPRVGPVDGLYFRGRFYFGSGENSVRFRHIRRRPHVSACHTVGETFAVIVHGQAVEIDIKGPDQTDFIAYIREVYPTWDEWYPDEPAPYAFIEPTRMYAYAFEPSVVEQLQLGEPKAAE